MGFIDYEAGTAEMLYISALCHSCHNFIHSGRMQMILGTEEMPPEKYNDILQHGEKILGIALKKSIKHPFVKEMFAPIAEWDKWRLILDGQEYYSKFKDISEWYRFYNE